MNVKVKYTACNYSERRYLCGINTTAVKRTFVGSKIKTISFSNMEDAEKYIEEAVAGRHYLHIPIRWGVEETRKPIKQDFTIEISY